MLIIWKARLVLTRPGDQCLLLDGAWATYSQLLSLGCHFSIRVFLGPHVLERSWYIIRPCASTIPSLQTTKCAPVFPEVYLLCPFYQVCIRHGLCGLQIARYPTMDFTSASISSNGQKYIPTMDIQVCTSKVHKTVPVYFELRKGQFFGESSCQPGRTENPALLWPFQ